MVNIDLTERYHTMDDQSLVDIVRSPKGTFTEQALTTAREVLAERGVEVDVPKPDAADIDAADRLDWRAIAMAAAVVWAPITGVLVGLFGRGDIGAALVFLMFGAMIMPIAYWAFRPKPTA